MQIINSPILVLRAFRYADDKLIAECLSPTEGRVSFALRITHAKRAALRHTLFFPLSVLEVQWVKRARSTLCKAQAATTLLPMASLYADPPKQAMTLFLAEMLLHITKSEQVDEHLFSFILHSLEWLDTAQKGFANFHIVFLLRCSLFLGITPSMDESQHPYFDFMAGEFVALRPQHAHFIEGQEAEAFRQLMRMNFGNMHLFVLSRQERQRILQLILQYHRLHLPAMPEVKSIEVLSTLFEA